MTPDLLSDGDRYPTLTPAGRDLLRLMREHPHAPIYRNESGNRLSADEVEQVRALEREALGAPIDWQPNQPPAWMRKFVARSIERVPAYRRYGAPPASFTDLPTIDRSDLSRDIAQYVPDDVDVDRLINFRTSGTTGHPLLVASHPLVAAQYLGYHKRALRRFGIELQHGRGQVGLPDRSHRHKIETEPPPRLSSRVLTVCRRRGLDYFPGKENRTAALP